MRVIAWTVLITGIVSTGAAAQQPAASNAASQSPAGSGDAAQAPAAAPAAPTEPAVKRVGVTAGIDATSAYMFRGIYQEDAGFIAQPWVDVALNVYKGSGPLKGIIIDGGNWNSQHSGPTGKWYESDYYGSVAFAFGKLKPGALYTSYTSPADKFQTVHEIAAVLTIDDSTSRLPLSPKILLGFELSGQADAGQKKGEYLELGVRPNLKLSKKLNVAIPAKLGLSLKDYYEGPSGSETFGYFDTGAIASVPFSSGKTSWDIHGGVDLLWFGDNLMTLNSGNRFKPVASIGIGFSY